MSQRATISATWAPGVLSVAMALGTLVLAAIGSLTWATINALPFFVASVLAGCLIASRRPGNLVGWIMITGGLSFTAMTFTGAYALYGLVDRPGSLPGGRAMAWPQTWMWVPGAACLYLLLPLYFPDGRLLSTRWRWLPISILMGAAYLTVSSALTPGDEFIQINSPSGAIVNPIGNEGALEVLPRRVSWVLSELLPLLAFCLFVATVTSLLIRFHRSHDSQRQQMKWLAWVLGALPVLIVVDLVSSVVSPFIGIYLICIPLAVGIAILRHNLYNIDVIINRTIVYGALTVLVVGIYILLVGYLGALLQANIDVDDDSGWRMTISLIATGAVAVLFHPAREHLQRGVNRLMYGERDEPYLVLSRLGNQLEGALAPEAALTLIVETLREAFRLPYAAIALHENDGPVTAAASGTPRGTPLRLPLVHQRQAVGELLLAPRGPRERFGAADRRLLEDLTRQIGLVANNLRLANETTRLNADLQRSREQIVLSREEEYRRLRRELHDGLAPTLAALNLRAGAIRTLLASDPDAAAATMDAWRADLRATIAAIRRLAYELRPPILDELGLVAAIEERAGRLHATGCAVTISAPPNTEALPAAVEVAAYRIVQEALANVERHAQATRCEIRLWHDTSRRPSLRIEISDNGVGAPLGDTRWQGVGVRSMEERAAELGGVCTLMLAPGGGTRVSVTLPTGPG